MDVNIVVIKIKTGVDESDEFFEGPDNHSDKFANRAIE